MTGTEMVVGSEGADGGEEGSGTHNKLRYTHAHGTPEQQVPPAEVLDGPQTRERTGHIH